MGAVVATLVAFLAWSAIASPRERRDASKIATTATESKIDRVLAQWGLAYASTEPLYMNRPNG
jgi:hypothetical protein